MYIAYRYITFSMKEVRSGTETSCMRFAVQTSQLGSNCEAYILVYARLSTTIHSRVALQGVWPYRAISFQIVFELD